MYLERSPYGDGNNMERTLTLGDILKNGGVRRAMGDPSERLTLYAQIKQLGIFTDDQFKRLFLHLEELIDFEKGGDAD